MEKVSREDQQSTEITPGKAISRKKSSQGSSRDETADDRLRRTRTSGRTPRLHRTEHQQSSRQSSFQKRSGDATAASRAKGPEVTALEAPKPKEACLRPSRAQLKRRTAPRRHRSCNNVAADAKTSRKSRRHCSDPARITRLRACPRESSDCPPRKPRRHQGDPAVMTPYCTHGRCTDRKEKDERSRLSRQASNRCAQSNDRRRQSGDERDEEFTRDDQGETRKTIVSKASIAPPPMTKLKRSKSVVRPAGEEEPEATKSTKFLSEVMHRISRSQSCRSLFRY